VNPTLSPNSTLAHYTIVCKISAGGMGEVYLAEGAKLDRRVAPKTVGHLDEARTMLEQLKNDALRGFSMVEAHSALGENVRIALWPMVSLTLQ
jgi:hypothetical protein